MAFVRTKRVGDREYRQLVENYREGGKHRQRVLAHLGEHETLEDAVEAARAKLEATDTSKLEAAQKKERDWRYTLHKRFGEQLERYHGGQIPSVSEVAERARQVHGKHTAPQTDEIVGKDYIGRPVYARQEVEVPEEVEEYRLAFGDVHNNSDNPYMAEVDGWGSRYYYGGIVRFKRQLEEYESWCKRAEKLAHTYNSRKARLEKLEAVLEW